MKDKQLREELAEIAEELAEIADTALQFLEDRSQYGDIDKLAAALREFFADLALVATR